MALDSTAFRLLLLASATAAILLVGCLRNSEKIVTVTVTRTVTVASDAAPEPGFDDPRIEGRFRMVGTPIKTRNILRPQTEDFRRLWRFTPKCERGACPTTLRREIASGGTLRVELAEAGGVYTGVTRRVEPGTCPDGSAVRRGYRTTARVEIRVAETRRVAGRPVATVIRSRLTIVGRRVKGARCLPDQTFQEYRYDGELRG